AYSDININLLLAYQKLLADDFTALSQSLGGFNEALLMHKQTLQLPISDPLGFPEYQQFSSRVAVAVENSIRSAPEPLNDFNPIRAGALRILRLRLIDSFGQYRDIDCSEINTTHNFALPSMADCALLPPRITQPARINFRWL